MRYISVCSGIEAATVAWHPLGWTPVAFSEIEKFPSAVLAHHYPDTPNLGDMTQHEHWPIGPGSIDLLVGGTPCQSFSVAGLRKGLADPRGNLALTYLAIADRLRPKWIVWENVPGVLSSSGGRDFGSFLGALVELGYGFAYRVLDAQWFGVAQRRRRVFVVGHLGDWRHAAAVLLERESLRGHPAPSREARKAVAGTLGARASSGGGFSTDFESAGGLQPVAHCLAARAGSALCAPDIQTYIPVNAIGTMSGEDVAPCLIKSMESRAGSTQDAAVISTPMAVRRLSLVKRDNAAHTAVAMVNMQGSKSNAVAQADGPSYTLNAMHGHDVHAVAFSSNMSVPDCQTNGTTPTVKCGGSDGGNPPAVAIGFNPDQSEKTRSMGEREQQAPTLRAGAEAAVAFTPGNLRRAAGSEPSEQTFPTMKSSGGDQSPCVATTMAVRRLTPVECERLQGFPDGYTAIPWRGKAASECPDGPRYRALGNSMAVPVMRWIGERIAQLESKT